MTTLDMEGWNGWWSDVGVRTLYALEVPTPLVTSFIISLYWYALLITVVMYSRSRMLSSQSYMKGNLFSNLKKLKIPLIFACIFVVVSPVLYNLLPLADTGNSTYKILMLQMLPCFWWLLPLCIYLFTLH